MKFEDSKTKQNLEQALQGEALAHLKYQFYKSKLADISKEIEQELEEIVHNEKEHGKIWFKKLHSGVIPDDITNLKDAIAGEQYEAYHMYLDFALDAEEEGYEDIAQLFRSIAAIEAKHSEKFQNILEKIETNTLFKEKTKVEWKCLNCGHIHIGEKPPETCPICNHPQKYFTKTK